MKIRPTWPRLRRASFSALRRLLSALYRRSRGSIWTVIGNVSSSRFPRLASPVRTTGLTFWILFESAFGLFVDKVIPRLGLCVDMTVADTPRDNAICCTLADCFSRSACSLIRSFSDSFLILIARVPAVSDVLSHWRFDLDSSRVANFAEEPCFVDSTMCCCSSMGGMADATLSMVFAPS